MARTNRFMASNKWDIKNTGSLKITGLNQAMIRIKIMDSLKTLVFPRMGILTKMDNIHRVVKVESTIQMEILIQPESLVHMTI